MISAKGIFQNNIYYILLILVCAFGFYSIIFAHFSALDEARVTTRTSYYFPVVPSDSSDYAQIADNLIQYGQFSASQELPLEPEIHWPIGYPGFLAVTKAIGGSFVFSSVVQMIFAAFSGVLLFLMASRFLPKPLALIPPLLFIFDPSVAYYTVGIFTDGLFTSLIVSLIYFLFFYNGKYARSKWLFLALGALLGFATLVRPIAEFLILVLPFVYVVLKYNTIPIKKLSIVLLFFIIGFGALVTPWMIRNQNVFGSFMLADVGSKNLLLYNTQDFLTEKEITKNKSITSIKDVGYAGTDEWDTVRARLLKEIDIRIEKDGGTVLNYYAPVALGHIFDDPIGYTKFHLINTAPYFLAGSIRHYFISIEGPFKKRAGLPYTPHTNISQYLSSLLLNADVSGTIMALKALSFVLIEIAWRILLIFLALIALLTKNTQARMYMLLFWMLILYFAVLTGPVSLTRYRIVSDPYLLILATLGATMSFTYLRTLWNKFRNRKKQHQL